MPEPDLSYYDNAVYQHSARQAWAAAESARDQIRQYRTVLRGIITCLEKRDRKGLALNIVEAERLLAE